MSFSVVFIGAGNLASHLAENLSQSGYQIVQIFSRTEYSAKSLAAKTGSSWTCDLSKINRNADLYFTVLKDAVLREVLTGLDLKGKTVVHSSGSLPMEVLKEFTASYGVFYPMQTFTKGEPVDFSQIPVFIESSTGEVGAILKTIAESLHAEVHFADSRQRLALHMAAVFACNFVNHFYTVASSILEQHSLDISHIHPLMKETLRKALVMPPFDAQTGPAMRYDTNVISRHLEELSGDPDLSSIYAMVSQHIYKLHQK
jgi:predicted short-subunit dehydrogenase-like oxidoreductase (DUF2520 family)